MLIFPVFILALASLHAQPIIKGNVRDKATNVPLQYATIRVIDSNKGVMANENGDFALNGVNLPVKVQVSFIGYKTQVVDLITSDMEIFLEVSDVQLLDVEIFPKKYVITFVKKVYNKAKEMNKTKFISDAFYRQYVTDDARRLLNYTEAFYKTNTVYGGIKELKMTKGRYAIKEGFDPSFVSLIDGNAFTTIGARFFMFPYLLYMAYAPIGEDSYRHYEYKLGKRYSENGLKLQEILFQPKTGSKYNTNGKLVVDEETYAVHYYEVVDYFNSPVGWKIQRDAQVYYRDLGNGRIVTDKIVLKEKIDDTAIGTIYKTSYFYMIDHILGELNPSTMDKWTREGTNDIFSKFKLSNRDRINRLDYNPEFWRNNPIIARTALEEEIVAEFERTGAFGNLLPPTNGGNGDQ